MTIKLNASSFIIGALVGIVTVCLFGATTNQSAGNYQLSMAANDTYVVYGRMDTRTGKIETWKFFAQNGIAIPRLDSGSPVFDGIEAAK